MTPPDADAAAEPFSSRRIPWIAGIAIASFLIFLLALAFGGDLSLPPTAEPNTYSTSALGHQALFEFLDELGLRALRRTTLVSYPPEPGSVVVVAESQIAELDRDERAFFRELRRQAADSSSALLIVLPKWVGRPLRTNEGRWVESVSLLDPKRVRDVFENAVGGAGSAPRVIRPGPDALPRKQICETAWGENAEVELIVPQYLAPSEDLEVVARTRDGILAARIPRSTPSDPRITVVSDPDLINNYGLGRADHAAICGKIFRSEIGAKTVLFDERAHGYLKDASFLAEMLRFPLLLVTLHGLLVLGLACWAGMSRFGRPRPRPPRLALGKEPILDNTAKLLLHHGAIADGLRGYLQQSLRSVADRCALPRDLPAPVLLDRLNSLSRARGLAADVPALEKKVWNFSGKGTAAEKQALSLAQQLHAWRREMTHES